MSKVVGHGTSEFRNGNEGEAIEKRATRVTTEYKHKALANNQIIGNTLTSSILESVGGVTGLVGGPRGETSKSLDVLTLTISDAAAKHNWRPMGADSIKDAKGAFKNMFKRRIGTTIVREQSKRIRTRIQQEIADTSGGPRFGERERAQTAPAREDQADYAQAYAKFTKGPREQNRGGGRNGNRNRGGNGNILNGRG